MSRYISVLSIAGSDSGGCAGIQADIKSISANGAYAATVITATTAQNTLGVTDIHAIPISHLQAQLDAVFTDIEFAAVKIGMLHSSAVIETVQNTLKLYGIKKIVLDPVMVATSGDTLINEGAIESLKGLISDAYLITPNIPEAQILIGHPVTQSNLVDTAIEIGEKFHVSVLLKGGHLEDTEILTDVLYSIESKKVTTIKNPKIPTNHTHGTGCSLSSSIATHIARGGSLEVAVQNGCDYVHEAIKAGQDKVLGQGHGPINHFMLK